MDKLNAFYLSNSGLLDLTSILPFASKCSDWLALISASLKKYASINNEENEAIRYM